MGEEVGEEVGEEEMHLLAFVPLVPPATEQGKIVNFGAKSANRSFPRFQDNFTTLMRVR